jgi:hypothetical protein
MEEEYKERFEVVFDSIISRAIVKNNTNVTTHTTQQSIIYLKKSIENDMDKLLYFCDFLPSKGDAKFYEEVNDLDALKLVIITSF